jgi:arginase
MQIRYITTDNVSGDPGSNIDADRFRGLAGAGGALLDAGIQERLQSVGVTVDRVDVVPAGETSGDPIEDLARINLNMAQAVRATVADGVFPVLVGGNCSHIVGVLSGLQQAHGQRIGLLWLDAHGDFNTPGTSLSGMHGGMPVAVAAGLAFPRWREGAGMLSPLPTNRIVMVDVRNLDSAEEVLIRSTDVEIARFGEGFDPEPVLAAIDRLSGEVDHLYVHVDADILDSSLQPNHPTAEPDGPNVAAVNQVIAHAFGTGKVCAFAIVSINADGDGSDVALASGAEVLMAGLGNRG